MTIDQKQCLLKYLGYYGGEIDGSYGPQTRAATKKFQSDFGITIDGIAGGETEKALKHAVAYGMPEKNTTDAPTTAESPKESTGTFWDDIQYFDREEFRCKCGGKYCDGFPAEPQEKLVRLAEQVREHFGSPANLSSGLRCPTHNANVGGVYNSRHLSGKAMDFHVNGVSGGKLLAYVQTLPGVRYAYQISSNGKLTDYVHMDVE